MSNATKELKPARQTRSATPTPDTTPTKPEAGPPATWRDAYADVGSRLDTVDVQLHGKVSVDGESNSGDLIGKAQRGYWGDVAGLREAAAEFMRTDPAAADLFKKIDDHKQLALKVKRLRAQAQEAERKSIASNYLNDSAVRDAENYIRDAETTEAHLHALGEAIQAARPAVVARQRQAIGAVLAKAEQAARDEVKAIVQRALLALGDPIRFAALVGAAQGAGGAADQYLSVPELGAEPVQALEPLTPSNLIGSVYTPYPRKPDPEPLEPAIEPPAGSNLSEPVRLDPHRIAVGGPSKPFAE